MPALPLRMRDKAARVMPKRCAASVTLVSARYSRNTAPGCGGLCIFILVSLVIVLVINNFGIAVFKLECEPPVAVYGNAPMVLQIAR
nr:MAG TPA: hypothetical protein [Siphoviridae sp. ctmtD6]